MDELLATIEQLTNELTLLREQVEYLRQKLSTENHQRKLCINPVS